MIATLEVDHNLGYAGFSQACSDLVPVAVWKPSRCRQPVTFRSARAVRCVRCALGWTKRELRLDRGLDPERLTRAPRLPYKGSRGPHEEERAKIGRQEIRCQEDSSGKSSDLARAVGANRLARHPGAQSEGRRLQRRRGSRTGRDSRLL